MNKHLCCIILLNEHSIKTNDAMMNRHIRSLDTVTEKELKAISAKTVGVVGAGGLGGYVIEMLARFGVGTLKIIDGDVFVESNLNRQLLSTEANLGTVKVDAAALQVIAVNSGVKTETFHAAFSTENAEAFLRDVDVVIDCLDNIKTRLLLEQRCKAHNVPLVHGAVGAWSGQVMTILPGDDSLRNFYRNAETLPEPVGSAAFIPATIASYQVAECVKLLIGRGELLRHRMMYFDLLNNNNFVIDLKEGE